MFKNPFEKKDVPVFLETPAGLFTPSGNWFRVDRKTLDKYAGELFGKVPLEQLVVKSESWIRSTDSIGIVLSMTVLLFAGWLEALIFAVLAGLFWNRFRPSLAGVQSTKIIRIFDQDIVILVFALVPLSWFGMEGHFDKLGTGFLLFFMFRFGFIRKMGDRFFPSGKIPVNDRILNMLIIKHSIAEGITLPNLERMERDLLAAMEKSSILNKKKKQ